MNTGQDPQPLPSAGSNFQTTCWTMIFTARDGGAVEANAALGALCEAYWYPLYAFVRKKGYNPEISKDLVQGFLTRLLEKRDLATVDRRKGKFRSFLMASCAHYLANQRDHERAKKRGGDRISISIDGKSAEGRYRNEPAHHLTAERLFEKQWALTLLNRVMERLEQEQTQAGKARQFKSLKPALSGGAGRLPFAAIATDLGVSEDSARASAHRLRRRYRDLLREEIARTVDGPESVEEEIASLFTALV